MNKLRVLGTYQTVLYKLSFVFTKQSEEHRTVGDAIRALKADFSKEKNWHVKNSVSLALEVEKFLFSTQLEYFDYVLVFIRIKVFQWWVTSDKTTLGCTFLCCARSRLWLVRGSASALFTRHCQTLMFKGWVYSAFAYNLHDDKKL